MTTSNDPRVAIFTVTMNRLDYTRRTFESLARSTGIRYDHFVIDNGSTDLTRSYLRENRRNFAEVVLNDHNVGLDVATNQALDLIGGAYDYIIKIDNDCEFIDAGWLEALLEVQRELGDRIVLSPRAEGLGPPEFDGGHPRSRHVMCAGHLLGVSNHVGGLCLMAPTAAYQRFRFKNNPMHGNQDVLFSLHVRLELGYEMGYVEDVRVRHMDTTEGQMKRNPSYFAARAEQNRRVYGEPQLVTTLLYPGRRMHFLRQMHRAGLLELSPTRYLVQRLGCRLRLTETDEPDELSPFIEARHRPHATEWKIDSDQPGTAP